MIEILPPALDLRVFRAEPDRPDAYGLVMLRAASLRPGRRRRLARTALSFGLGGPMAAMSRRSAPIPSQPGDVIARFENQNGRFKAVATDCGVAVVPDEEDEDA